MDYTVSLNFQGPGFVAVPNHVADESRLSAEALGVLLYLARLQGSRPDTLVRVSAIQARFRLGKHRWMRIARELRQVGAISDLYGRTPCGRRMVRALSIQWPEPCGSENPTHSEIDPPACGSENPTHRSENPTDLGRKTRPLKKDQKQKGARDARGREASPPRGAGRRSIPAARDRGQVPEHGRDQATAGAWLRAARQAARDERWTHPDTGLDLPATLFRAIAPGRFHAALSACQAERIGHG